MMLQTVCTATLISRKFWIFDIFEVSGKVGEFVVDAKVATLRGILWAKCPFWHPLNSGKKGILKHMTSTHKKSFFHQI